MQVVSIGNSKVLECAKCLGLWLDTQSFEKLCADKEQQSAVLGNASLADRSIQHKREQGQLRPMSRMLAANESRKLRPMFRVLSSIFVNNMESGLIVTN